MSVPDGFVESLIFGHELVLMFSVLLLLEILLQIAFPFGIKSIGLFVIACLVQSCCLRSDSLVNHTQVSFLLHFFLGGCCVDLGRNNSQIFASFDACIFDLCLEGYSL